MLVFPLRPQGDHFCPLSLCQWSRARSARFALQPAKSTSWGPPWSDSGSPSSQPNRAASSRRSVRTALARRRPARVSPTDSCPHPLHSRPRAILCFEFSVPGPDITRRIEHTSAFLRQATQPPRLVWYPPTPGHRPDAFQRGPLSRATLPAASPQALRATHTTWAPPCPACRLSLFFTVSHPRVWNGVCSRGLGCAGPGDPATDPNSGNRDSLLSHCRSAASAFGASGSAASVSSPLSGPMCIPLSVPTILLSALSALPACQMD